MLIHPHSQDTSDITFTDLFAGAGGGTSGAVRVRGVRVMYAANHSKLSLASHEANHPETDHDLCDLMIVHPRRYKRTTALIAGPACTFHSNSRGDKRSKQVQPTLFEQKLDDTAIRSRATMNTVPAFAEYHHYLFGIVENVAEVMEWAEIHEWFKDMARLDYQWQVVSFNSMFGHLDPNSVHSPHDTAPQSRDRVYICFWKKWLPAPNLDLRPLAPCPRCGCNVAAAQVFKNGRKWGKYKRQYHYACPDCLRASRAKGFAGSSPKDVARWEVTPYHYSAMNIIDWRIPSVQIKDRERHGLRPLKKTTLTRLKTGINKQKKWMMVNLPNNNLAHRWAIVEQNDAETIAPSALIWNQSDAISIYNETHQPFIHSYYSRQNTTTAVYEPLPTVVGDPRHALAFPPFILNFKRNLDGTDIREPLKTVMGRARHHGIAIPPSFVYIYNRSNSGYNAPGDSMGTVTGVLRHALLQADQHAETLENWYFRMLAPSELKLAQAFKSDYILLGNNNQQIAQIGQAMSCNVIAQLTERMAAILK